MMVGNRSVTVSLLFLSALAVSTTEVRSGTELLSFHVQDETAPAGNMVQMKVEETEATPISGGRPRARFSTAMFEGVAGIGLFTPTGEAAGAAVLDGSYVTITYVTTTPLTGGEYPVLTVTLALREGLAPGSSTEFSLEPASIWTVDGRTIATKKSTADVTVGGTLAVNDVVPAGRSFPAGTVISVRGAGFDSRTRLRLNGNRRDDARVVSPTEIQFTLSQPTNMAGAQLRLDDSDNQSVTYYAYLRGIPAATSQRPLLAATMPVFSGVARTVSTFGSIPFMAPPYQYAALALQNPNLEPVSMTLVLYAANGGVLAVSTRSLESGHRWALELSEIFGGVRPPAVSSVRVLASQPIQMFGMVIDDRIRTITPRLPVEARP
jgi:hypothetical protein